MTTDGSEYRGIGVNVAQLAAVSRIVEETGRKSGWLEPASHGLVAWRSWRGPHAGGSYVTSLLNHDGALVREFSDRPVAEGAGSGG